MTGVSDAILNKRNEHVTKLLTALYDAEALLGAGESVEAKQLHDSLLRQMQHDGLPKSKPDAAFWRSSVFHLGSVILGLEAPRSPGVDDWEPDYNLETPVISALGEIEGLNVESFVL